MKQNIKIQPFCIKIIIILFMIVSWVQGQRSSYCQNCEPVLEYGCSLCIQYCTYEQIAIYQKCSYNNCSATQQNNCMNFQNRINNGSTNPTKQLCQSKCCRNTNDDYYIDIRSSCLQSSNQIMPVYISYLIALGIAFGLLIIIYLIRKWYQKRNQQNIELRRSRNSRRISFFSGSQNQLQSQYNNINNRSSASQQTLAQINTTNFQIPVDSQCPICLDQNTNTLTNCKHFFHFKCILEWYKRNNECPLCKSNNISDVYIKCVKCQRSFVYASLDNSIRNAQMLGNNVIIGGKCQQCLHMEN